jgi:uncharacterized SAM-binding protein YcdF (DUF218 family)
LWRAGLLAATVLVVYAGLTLVQVWLTSRTDEAPASDAIVVLGAAQYDCRPSPVLAQRLDHAHELYGGGVAGTIVVTGGKQAGDRCTEASTSADYLRGRGVPDEDLLLEVEGRNTWESLAATGHILRDRGLTRVVLVTDGYHALRVKAIADQIGLEPSVSPTRRAGSLADYVKETGAVAVGRIIGFDRLVDIDDQLEQIDQLDRIDQIDNQAAGPAPGPQPAPWPACDGTAGDARVPCPPSGVV